ncbi:MAG TPA: ABC transporter permease [Vicinamibacterales bacterium]|nr:ABC transporter permease [Vicinamibacterales bacterium]
MIGAPTATVGGMRPAAAVGVALLALIAAASIAAPLLAPHDPSAAFRDRAFAPPMRPRLVDADGGWHAPFVYPLRLANRLEQRYEEDRTRRLPLAFFSGGRLVRVADESGGPWLPLGGDGSGRDVLARLLFGARTSLGLALVASLSAILLGVVVGGAAGYLGGAVDEALMRVAEFALVLPAVYIVLALRAVLPLVLSPWTVFVLMTGIFAVVGWPWVARAVRGVVATEMSRDYVAAARSLGAGPARILGVHVLPACAPVVAAQAILLVPGFVLAEATLSYLGLGFPDSVPSWGSMLQDAANVNVIARFPWMLLPAAAIFAVTLAVNLVLESRGGGPLLESPSGGSR